MVRPRSPVWRRWLALVGMVAAEEASAARCWQQRTNAFANACEKKVMMGMNNMNEEKKGRS